MVAILFGRRVTVHATMEHGATVNPASARVPVFAGPAKPAKPMCRGLDDARAYMKARNKAAKADRRRLDRRQTTADCVAAFAPGSCKPAWAATAFRDHVDPRLKRLYRPK